MQRNICHRRVGLGWVEEMMGWVGLGYENWTHGHVWYANLRVLRWMQLSGVKDAGWHILFLSSVRRISHHMHALPVQSIT